MHLIEESALDDATLENTNSARPHYTSATNDSATTTEARSSVPPYLPQE